jgi:hypothetical protein
MYYRRGEFCFAFLWAKGLNAKDIHKEMFPVYGGKCFWRIAVHNWVEKFFQGRSKVADYARSFAEVAETTRRLLYAPLKRWDKCISVGGCYVEK